MIALTGASYEDLARRLAEAEATIDALLTGQIDAVVDAKTQSHVLLPKAQDALRASEERYRRIVETSNEGILTIDESSTISFVNKRFGEMLGYAPDEIVGKSLSEFLPEAAAARASRRLERARHGASEENEVEVARRDGSEMWALVKTVPIRGINGEFAGVLAMITDKTRDRNAGVALRTSEARFRQLWESAVVAEKDLQERMRIAALAGEVGMALTCETALVAMLERSAAAIVHQLGVAFTMILTLDADKQELEVQATAGSLGVPRGTRVRVGQLRVGRVAEQRRPQRTNDMVADSPPSDPIWPGMTAFAGHPLLVNGQLVGVLAVFSSLPISDPVFTGLGSISDAIAVGIHRKMVTRTNAALELQLRQSQKMEAVGRLAGGIAHDFNNILTVILTCSRFLLEDLNALDPARADAAEILEAGERAAALTRQLLMFSRQQVLEPKVLDLAEVTENLQGLLRRLLGEDVELVVRSPAELGRVRADPGSIEQMIMNLVVNARDAMPTGGTLTIGCRNEIADEGGRVVLSVTDTGTGIDAATQTRMFEPFYTTKEIGKGTGLGLSTVFGIVQQSRGTIRVESELGRGTTFEISLPAVDAIADARVVTATTVRRGTETVLLVEDEDQVRAVARAILLRSGFRVIEMRNAAEAIAYCQRRPETLDLLLTDLVMPQMSGTELARQLALILPGLKVLCMSGYTDDSLVRHGVREAHIAFLQKPFSPETLTLKVREVLDG